MDHFVSKSDLSVYESKDLSSYSTYFNAILENFDEEAFSNLFLDDQEDEKYFLLDNVYEYVEKDLLSIILSRKTSKSFEIILERSTIVQLLSISSKLFHVDFLEQLCFHRFSSYTIQKMVKMFGFVLGFSHSKFDISKSCTKYLNRLATIVLEKPLDFCKSPFASHIVRELLSALNKKENEKLPVLIHSIYQSVNFEWADDPILCSLLQYILNISEEICDKFMSSCLLEIKSSFKTWVLNQNSSRLVEQLIASVSIEHLQDIYSLIFKGNMLELAKNDSALYSIKHMLTRLEKEKLIEHIQDLFVELIDADLIWQILKSRHFSVIVAFLQHLSQFSIKTQQLLLETIMTHSKEREGNHFFNIVSLNEEEPKIAGSLVLQNMYTSMDLNDCELNISLSLLDKSIAMRLLCHNSASHVFNSFFNSTLLKSTYKLEFFDSILSDSIVSLAMDKYGCRVVESAWKELDMKRKLNLMEKVAPERNNIIKSPHGRKFAQFCSIDAYRKDQYNWRKMEVTKMRNVLSFKSVIGNAKPIVQAKEGLEDYTKASTVLPTTAHSDLDPILEAIKGNSTMKKRKKSGEKKSKKKKTKTTYEVEVLE